MILTSAKIKEFSLYAVAIIITATAFLHVLFPPESEILFDLRKEHSKTKIERNETDKSLKKILYAYQKGSVSIDQFNSSIPLLITKYKAKEKESLNLFNKITQEKRKERIFGFRNTHSFVYSISFPLCFLFLSIVILFFSVTEKLKILSKAIASLAFTIMFISLFFLSWVFLPISDLPYWSYILSIFICAVMVSSFLRFLLNWRVNILNKKYNIDRTTFLENALELSSNIIKSK